MPKGYPINPELTRQRRSESHKKRIRSVSWYKNVRNMLIKRNKDPKHIVKVKKALMGHGFTAETLKKMSDKARINTRGEGNPNWRGDKVGKIGIHLWLHKNYKKKLICEFCGKKERSGRKIEWAKLKDKDYERKRDNFIELCCKCHRKYDGIGFKKGHTMNLGKKHKKIQA